MLTGLAHAQELRASRRAVWRVWPDLDLSIPRGQVTEWVGPRSAGKTAALRFLVRSVLEAGAGVAYVDGTGTLVPSPWVVGRLGPNGAAPFWVVRPPEPRGVLVASEELLASGVFGLVIAEGTDWTRTPVVRLQRLARQADAALVAVAEGTGVVPLAGRRVVFDPQKSAPPEGERRVRIRGRDGSREVTWVQDLPYRLSADSGTPDRRGVSPTAASQPSDGARYRRRSPRSYAASPSCACSHRS